MNINLHIERLILEGISLRPEQQQLLEAGVIAELTRLLSNGGLPPGLIGGINLARLYVNGVQLKDDGSTQISRQIAESVYGVIGYE